MTGKKIRLSADELRATLDHSQQLRTNADRAFAASERGRVRMRLDFLRCELGEKISPFVHSRIKKLNEEYEELCRMIDSFDKRRSARLRSLAAAESVQNNQTQTMSVPVVVEMDDECVIDSIPLVPGALAQARLKRGLTFEELAQRTGITDRTLREYEKTAFRCATFEYLCLIAKVLSD